MRRWMGQYTIQYIYIYVVCARKLGRPELSKLRRNVQVTHLYYVLIHWKFFMVEGHYLLRKERLGACHGFQAV